MDKYLLLFGFQLTQALTLGALDPALWRALSEQDPTAIRLDTEAFGLVFQTLVSGTWLGRISEIGGLLVRAVDGLGALPLALVVAQWVVVLGFVVVERRVLARRLATIEGRN